MLEILIIAVAGSVLAGLWDLKTTEVPDQLPIGMVVIGIAYWILQGFLGNCSSFNALHNIYISLFSTFGICLKKQ